MGEDLQREVALWIADGKSYPSLERVEELWRSYPSFTLPAALLLARGGRSLTEDTRRILTERLVLTSSDPASLQMLIDNDIADFASFYPAAQSSDSISTESAIDKFIDLYGSEDAYEEEVLTRLIFNPTPDYAQLLAREEAESLPEAGDAQVGSQDQLINDFIMKTRNGKVPFDFSEKAPCEDIEPSVAVPEQPQAQRPVETDDSLLSESLAKIYIKRGNYDKAHEIITNLSLNFSEKSVYFADQLRFLEKLMAIRKHGQQIKQKNKLN